MLPLDIAGKPTGRDLLPLIEYTWDPSDLSVLRLLAPDAPEKQGFAAVDLLVKFLKGQPIDSVDTGVKVYTKDNIAEVAKK